MIPKLGQKFAPMFGTVKTVVGEILSIAIFASAFSQAQCPTDFVMIKGRVERSPHNAIVRAQLVYSKHSKQQQGESGEVTLENEFFRIQIPFLTQSRAPVFGIGTFACDRKPKTVVVTLVANDHEYDRVSLDLAKDFKMADPSAYAQRAEIVLSGVH